ncbi:MAG: ABC transporter ATP-binding protein [Lachnospiraceae bacterium]|jgi:ABC-2 type transport system ATP-binding protein|nr:ABC transporter ATP-binding protein [Lachnospiraceae bacterium]MEE3461980.1 ABC transporter ATP-binding protein [Lachnospiraceae bacterium]
MIEIKNLVKNFGIVKAVNDISLNIEEGNVFGLIGTNGAGKSTMLRMTSGVLKADGGEILIDGLPVYDNPEAKAKVTFIPDDPYFFGNASPKDMEAYYSSVYKDFDKHKFNELLKAFNLDPKRRVSEFSKGMKRQLAMLLGLSTNTKYLLLDEVFDGLDPVMRQGMKSLFAREMDERGLTPVISSHNLRELEDICDHIGFLHTGGLILSQDLADMKLGIQKLQCVFKDEADYRRVSSLLDVVNHESRGRMHTIVVRGTECEVDTVFNSVDMVFFEMLPLTLEEIFITETEAKGYDTRKLISE